MSGDRLNREEGESLPEGVGVRQECVTTPVVAVHYAYGWIGKYENENTREGIELSLNDCVENMNMAMLLMQSRVQKT